MKIKQYLFLLCASAGTYAYGVPTPNADSNTVVYRSEDVERQEGLLLYAPVDFGQGGVRTFLQDAYNRPEYSQDVLPNSFAHLAQFLRHGKKTQQNRAYVKSVMKLFNNKLKSCQYINAYAFDDFLAQLPDLVGNYFLLTRTNKLAHYKETLNSILYSTFLSQYDFFKKNPHEFFDSLSQEILNTLENELPSLHDDVSLEDLRSSIVRFLETALNKLVWSPEEHEQIWNNMKSISRQLETLIEYNILDDTDDLDDLFWSLTHRFCFFLEITGPQLPAAFYETIKNDLANQQLLLLEIEEQEPCIESKAKRLVQAIVEGLAKKQAAEKGIILKQ